MKRIVKGSLSDFREATKHLPDDTPINIRYTSWGVSHTVSANMILIVDSDPLDKNPHPIRVDLCHVEGR